MAAWVPDPGMGDSRPVWLAVLRAGAAVPPDPDGPPTRCSNPGRPGDTPSAAGLFVRWAAGMAWHQAVVDRRSPSTGGAAAGLRAEVIVEEGTDRLDVSVGVALVRLDMLDAGQGQ